MHGLLLKAPDCTYNSNTLANQEIDTERKRL